MINIIETNIIVDDENNIIDHQSRMLIVPSWNEYITLYTEYDGKANGRNYCTYNNNLLGCVLPHGAVIQELKYNDFHLYCSFKLFDRTRQIKLAYLS